MGGRSPESGSKVEKKALRRIWDTETTDAGTPWLEREARAGVQDMEGAQSGEAKLECVSHASLCDYLWVGSWL